MTELFFWKIPGTLDFWTVTVPFLLNPWSVWWKCSRVAVRHFQVSQTMG